MRTTKTIKLAGSDRVSIRHELINIFLDEEPGSGTGELCSHYIYFVEDLPTNQRVYLKRPAMLNKGFDFEVHAENLNFGVNRFKSRPSHSDVISDLNLKQAENPVLFQQVLRMIDDLFNCQEIDQEELQSFQFNKGFPIEVMLKVIKWLFIEQDITYWNWSGRSMFYKAINHAFNR